MLELYQAEWCPHSHRVRRRLTELGVDFVARQVRARKDERDDMAALIGTKGIPALVLEDGTVIEEEGPIVEYLDRTYEAPPDAAAHRANAQHPEAPRAPGD